MPIKDRFIPRSMTQKNPNSSNSIGQELKIGHEGFKLGSRSTTCRNDGTSRKHGFGGKFLKPCMVPRAS